MRTVSAELLDDVVVGRRVSWLVKRLRRTAPVAGTGARTRWGAFGGCLRSVMTW